MSARQNHEKVLWTITNLEVFLRQAQSRPTGLASGGPAKPAETVDLRTPGFAQ
jgi:hypothetical protein